MSVERRGHLNKSDKQLKAKASEQILWCHRDESECLKCYKRQHKGIIYGLASKAKKRIGFSVAPQREADLINNKHSTGEFSDFQTFLFLW